MNEYLTFEDLKQHYGIPYSRVHTGRLVRAGRFPKSFSFGDGRRRFWLKSEVEQFIADRTVGGAASPNRMLSSLDMVTKQAGGRSCQGA